MIKTGKTDSINISVGADTVSAQAEIKALLKTIQKLQNQRIPLDVEMKSLASQATDAEIHVLKVKKELEEISKARKISVEEANHSMQSDSFYTIDEADAKYLADCEKKASELRERASEARKELEVLNAQLERTKEAYTSAQLTGSRNNSYAESVEYAKRGLEGASKAAENLSQNLSEAASNSSAIGENANVEMEQAANAAGRMSKELSESKVHADGVSESVKKIDGEAKETASGIKGKLGSALQTVCNSFDKFGNLIANNFTKAGNEAEKSATKTKSTFSSSLKSTESAFSKFGKRISSTLKSALIFSVIYKGLSQLKSYLSAALSTNKQFSDSLVTLKSNLAVAFQPIFQAILPHLITFVNWLIKAVQWVSALIHVLTGSSVSSSQRAAQELQNSINATKSGASGATAAEKQLTAAIKEKQSQVKALQRENKKLQREYEQQKKAVEAQTDEIEKQISTLEKEIDAIEATEQAMNKAAAAQREAIQSNIDALQKKQAAISKERSAVQKEQEQAQKAVNAQKAAIDNQIKAINNQIKALQKRKKAEEKARKENQKFTADFDELSTLGSVDKEDPLDLDIEKLQEQAELLQEQKEAIEDVDYSARLEALDAENEKLQEQIDMLQEQKEAIKDVDLSGSVASYEAQISSLRERIQELNDNLVENPQIEQNELLIEQLQEEIDLLQEQKDALEESSGASSGFVQLKDTISDLNDVIKNSPLLSWLSEIDNQDALLGVIGTLGILAVTIGGVIKIWEGLKTIMLLFGPNGLVVVAVLAGIGSLLAIFLSNEESLENLKKAFGKFGEAIKLFVSGDFESAKKALKEGFEYIGKAFSAAGESWKQTFSEIWSGIKTEFSELKEDFLQDMAALGNMGIDTAEGLINAIIRGLNWCAERINDIFSFEIPDWIPKYGGKTFSANLGTVSEVSLSRIPVPALAQGAVLPPNKPFMAWVGDQKNGTNIEAPLSTIEDAMRNVMAEQEFNFNINADGSLGALIRLLKLKLTRESERETAF